MCVRVVRDPRFSEVADKGGKLLNLFVTAGKVERHFGHVVHTVVADAVDLQTVFGEARLELLVVTRILILVLLHPHHRPLDAELLHELQILVRCPIIGLRSQLDAGGG